MATILCITTGMGLTDLFATEFSQSQSVSHLLKASSQLHRALCRQERTGKMKNEGRPNLMIRVQWILRQFRIPSLLFKLKEWVYVWMTLRGDETKGVCWLKKWSVQISLYLHRVVACESWRLGISTELVRWGRKDKITTQFFFFLRKFHPALS